PQTHTAPRSPLFPYTTLFRSFPLIGVAPAGAVALPRSSDPHPAPEAVPLEPHHSHFLLVPGERWGDESPWLAAVVAALAGDRPSDRKSTRLNSSHDQISYAVF